MLTAAEVDEMVADGTLDTILVVFPDLQGRLMGKRVTGHYWVDHMVEVSDKAFADCTVPDPKGDEHLKLF